MLDTDWIRVQVLISGNLRYRFHSLAFKHLCSVCLHDVMMCKHCTQLKRWMCRRLTWLYHKSSPPALLPSRPPCILEQSWRLASYTQTPPCDSLYIFLQPQAIKQKSGVSGVCSYATGCSTTVLFSLLIPRCCRILLSNWLEDRDWSSARARSGKTNHLAVLSISLICT